MLAHSALRPLASAQARTTATRAFSTAPKVTTQLKEMFQSKELGYLMEAHNGNCCAFHLRTPPSFCPVQPSCPAICRPAPPSAVLPCRPPPPPSSPPATLQLFTLAPSPRPCRPISLLRVAYWRRVLRVAITRGHLVAMAGLSAKIVAETGFKGIWASGLSMSASLGVRDANEASWTQVHCCTWAD